MVDDSMEISSDHGHDASDEDIDIDIDITVGQVDEDYVLEDAASNVDPGDNVALETSLLVCNDDVMIDEDDGSYPMNDAELIHDGQEQNMEDEAAAMSFVTVNHPHFDDNENTATNGAALDEFNGQSELMWEQEEEPSPEEPDVQLEDTQDTLHEEGQFSLDKGNSEVFEPSKADYEHDSRTVTPRQASPENLAVEEPRSPPASNPERRSASRHGSSHRSDTGHSPPKSFNADVKGEHIVSPDDVDTLHEVHDIVIIYQSGEYALFGRSDSEDPDSFFLSDLSIADKPIFQFFKAMREVIHEDLTPEEELYLSVDDLGLEIEETVSSLHDVTLAQILNLHEKLLRNDGVATPRALCIGLGTRPSFARRLANLVAGAADGKGLSQLVTLDEQSEEFNNSGVVEEQFQIHDRNSESELPSENFGDKEEAPVTKLPEDAGTSHTTPPETDEEPRPLQEFGHVQGNQLTATAEPQRRKIKQDLLSAARELPNNETPYDEDGDLIDYSDDEDHNPVELRPVGSQAGSQAAHDLIDDDRANNEYEAINEELRRRSLSRAADEGLLEQTKEQNPATSTAPNEVDKQQKHPKPQADIEYVVENEDEWGRDGVEESNAYLTGEITEATLDLDNQEFEDLIDEEVGEDGEVIETSHAGRSRNLTGPEGEEYTDSNGHGPLGDTEYGDFNEAEQYVDLPQPDRAPQTGTLAMNDGKYQAQQNAGYKTGNPTTVSADESHRDDGLDTYGDLTSAEHEDKAGNLDQEDEIDYEDHEEEQVSKEVQELKQAEKQLPATNGGAGKRARTDSDEAMTMRTKDAKRPRS